MADAVSERKILVINCGSSSLKYEIWQMPERVSLGKGIVERIGELKGRIVQNTPRGEYAREVQVPHHKMAMQLVREALTDPARGILKDLAEIAGVGHRVVHGGEHYAASVVIDEAVVKAVEECADLAPLHNPPNLSGIREAQAVLPDVKQVAVFDTAFHQTHAPGRLPLRPALRAVREVPHPPLRLPRHQPPLRRRAGPWSC